MTSPLSLLIALRFSRGRRRGGMVSLISVISTIGIALGVAVLIVGLSAMNGFERELNNRILAVVAAWRNRAGEAAVDQLERRAGEGGKG
ncbi:Lipoprotein-releasing system transmembrane protein lolE [Raoultella ornithinolytica]|nr:Lipoprotein-releasing system transmembrane protein lolE [Raoultella ornithinolytica]